MGNSPIRDFANKYGNILLLAGLLGLLILSFVKDIVVACALAGVVAVAMAAYFVITCAAISETLRRCCELRRRGASWKQITMVWYYAAVTTLIGVLHQLTVTIAKLFPNKFLASLPLYVQRLALTCDDKIDDLLVEIAIATSDSM